mmetsp:Transcript_37537/g.85994  ORF Transcript_37537/g.85994 Transcript_37537/m.85994 type:complete len:238 (-) Transcript_37537:1857-2570(-)
MTPTDVPTSSSSCVSASRARFSAFSFISWITFPAAAPAAVTSWSSAVFTCASACSSPALELASTRALAPATLPATPAAVAFADSRIWAASCWARETTWAMSEFRPVSAEPAEDWMPCPRCLALSASRSKSSLLPRAAARAFPCKSDADFVASFARLPRVPVARLAASCISAVYRGVASVTLVLSFFSSPPASTIACFASFGAARACCFAFSASWPTSTPVAVSVVFLTCPACLAASA